MHKIFGMQENNKLYLKVASTLISFAVLLVYSHTFMVKYVLYSLINKMEGSW